VGDGGRRRARAGNGRRWWATVSVPVPVVSELARARLRLRCAGSVSCACARGAHRLQRAGQSDVSTAQQQPSATRLDAGTPTIGSGGGPGMWAEALDAHKLPFGTSSYTQHTGTRTHTGSWSAGGCLRPSDVRRLPSAVCCRCRWTRPATATPNSPSIRSQKRYRTLTPLRRPFHPTDEGPRRRAHPGRRARLV
jgi:hypothetical protein